MSPADPDEFVATDRGARWPRSADRSDLLLRLLLILGTLAYAVILSAIYTVKISPEFTYIGYVLLPGRADSAGFAVMLAALPSLWMPVRLLRPSQTVYWLLFILVYVPGIIVPHLSLARPLPELYLMSITLLLAIALLGLATNLPTVKVRRFALPSWLFWSAFIAVTTILLYGVISSFGVTMSLPRLSEIYTVRSEFKETEVGRFVRYGVSWIGNVLGPFLIALGLLRKAPKFVIGGVALELYIFTMTGFRSVLFSSILILGLYVALGWRGRYFGLLMVWGAATLVSGTWLVDAVQGRVLLTSMFVRRLIITPGILTGWYYDFFSSHPKVRLSHSVLSPFLDYPYDRLPPLLIGDRYFGREETYANANVWADAFANFGFMGMIGYTVVVAIMLMLFDAIGKSDSWERVKLSSLMLAVPAFTLSNTALQTSILTHGIALAWLLLYFVPRAIHREPEVTARAGSCPPGRRG